MSAVRPARPDPSSRGISVHLTKQDEAVPGVHRGNLAFRFWLVKVVIVTEKTELL